MLVKIVNGYIIRGIINNRRLPAKINIMSEALKQQIDKLATFILENCEGYPNQDEGAVDTAIRIIKDLQNKRIPEDWPWRKHFDAQKQEFENGKTMAIPYILIPSDKTGNDIMAEPDILEHHLLTSQLIELDGKYYDKLEYLPEWVNLCGGGNAERIRGNKVRFLKKESVTDNN